MAGPNRIHVLGCRGTARDDRPIHTVRNLGRDAGPQWHRGTGQ